MESPAMLEIDSLRIGFLSCGIFSILRDLTGHQRHHLLFFDPSFMARTPRAPRPITSIKIPRVRRPIPTMSRTGIPRGPKLDRDPIFREPRYSESLCVRPPPFNPYSWRTPGNNGKFWRKIRLVYLIDLPVPDVAQLLLRDDEMLLTERFIFRVLVAATSSQLCPTPHNAM